MSKQTQQFFEQLKAGQQPGLLETIREAAASMKAIGGQMWDSAKPMFDHGRTEVAAALFSGNAHVMYMKGPKGIEQGQDQVRDQDQVKEMPERQQDIGREL